MKTYYYWLLLFLLINCNGSKKTKIKQNSTIGINYNGEFQVNKLKKCIIKLNNNISDSLNLSDGDVKYHTIYLNIFDIKTDEYKIRKIDCDTFYNYTKSINHNLTTPFYLKPKIKGKRIIAGFIDEELELKSYGDSTQSRVIGNRYYFKKKIYVKDSTD